MKKNYSVKKIMQTLWQSMRPFRWHMVALFALAIIANACGVIVPLFYKAFFDVLSKITPAETRVPELMRLITIILAINGFSWMCWRINVLLSNYIQPHVKKHLETSSFSYMMDHSYTFFSNAFVGSLVRKVHRLASAFERLADEIQWNILGLIVVVFGDLIILYMRDVRLGLVLTICAILIGTFNVAFATWKLKFDYAKSLLDSESTAVMSDALTNSITIKLFTSQEHEKGLFENVMERWRKAQTHLWNIEGIAEAVQAGLMVLAEFAMFSVAIHLWQRGLLTIGDFALIQSFMVGIFQRMWSVGKSVRHIYEAFADAAEMVEILETPYEVKDYAKAKSLIVSDAVIAFNNVTFKFNKTRTVLNGLSMQIAPHEKIALVGPSGAGKSTITKLLMRFHDVESGSITIDGQNIAKVTQNSLRASVAMVPQEPILFHRSLMDNIRYGRPSATDEEVFEAARRAKCHDFIMELPETYQTFVGERGIKLSGGERQRIAIARAILKNAPILVLDEATSSLDSESESLIQSALEELMKGKTTIVIAHRLSTIMRMDRIIVIDGGQAVDSGTHDQLLGKEGIYKKLWDIQAGGFIE
ncbi:MAG: ABC transporter ATP-binding protein [Candidatus Uhrbacteria bacterium]|nr:ABC transporter ATP-binding protein [Candidatus Uhrbacteria bacterium]